ncbi:hypothetical protein NE686_17380 [Tissierella carlieri]|uniref:Uncharacterized protein n=1 Tax=Tissierella carlieri TaxID=689904 RepID=A0ABT1SEG7_9FIRM|nr:hypothetical protein [Tissierella carlieri]MCQ4924878.1 hypothetical protein [Tissierella carlieri]
MIKYRLIVDIIRFFGSALCIIEARRYILITYFLTDGVYGEDRKKYQTKILIYIVSFLILLCFWKIYGFLIKLYYI